jgi:hypothetical protein
MWERVELLGYLNKVSIVVHPQQGGSLCPEITLNADSDPLKIPSSQINQARSVSVSHINSDLQQ